MPHRRDWFRLGAWTLGGMFGSLVAFPGLRYLLGPLRRSSTDRPFVPLTRLGQLEAGRPRSFAVLAERTDAWVRYPREPIGSVWLVRQPEGAEPRVVALSAECPHLSCPINLEPGGSGFVCPCHGARFSASGTPLNAVSPRGMDTLAVELTDEADPEVRVRFERFQPQSKAKNLLA